MSQYSWIRDPITAGLDEIHHSWGWVLALGIGLVITGAVCILAASTATLMTVLVFGWLLLIGAAISLVHAFQSGTSGSFFLHLMSVLLRGVTGFLLVRYPSVGAVSLTLVLASFFIVGGMFRAVGCAALQLPRWGWGALSGVISVALGIVLLLQLSTLSIWFIGWAVSIDMIFDGVGLAAMGLALHHLPGGRKLIGG
jgi:uncharacterized membrane protein HdeD (DUF308 family)